MGADVHALAGFKLHRAGVIEKTPCPHHPLLAIGEGAADNHAVAKVGVAGRDADDRVHGRCPRGGGWGARA